MTNENKNKDTENEPEAELEARLEKKWDAWGNRIDQTVNAFEKKIPRPVNALSDALCITVVVAAAAWILKKLHGISALPSWSTWGIVFAALFVVSLLYRMFFKRKK